MLMKKSKEISWTPVVSDDLAQIVNVKQKRVK
jgi:hypothetical protein